jgi:RAB6-interacting golgin
MKIKQVANIEEDENQNRMVVKSANEEKRIIDESQTVIEKNDHDKNVPIVPEVEEIPQNNKISQEFDLLSTRTIEKKDFELHRKLMEEQNKMKRDLLQQAISKHAEKTQAENKKLTEIKCALDVLDSELSQDVAILRKQIENATIHFNSVEKNYSAIERSFLKAKQDLYHAHEKKEMLTEHLYTIIAHNEDRKAKKLSELMEKVGLTLNENGS